MKGTSLKYVDANKGIHALKRWKKKGTVWFATSAKSASVCVIFMFLYFLTVNKMNKN